MHDACVRVCVRVHMGQKKVKVPLTEKGQSALTAAEPPTFTLKFLGFLSFCDCFALTKIH